MEQVVKIMHTSGLFGAPVTVDDFRSVERAMDLAWGRTGGADYYYDTVHQTKHRWLTNENGEPITVVSISRHEAPATGVGFN